jgi:hypothetical protein
LRQGDENRWQRKPKALAECISVPSQGTEGQNNPAKWGGLEGKKKIRPQESCFYLTPFIELIRT